MVKQSIQSSGAPEPGGPYSQAIAAGGWIFVSGQRPVDPTTGTLAEGITAQTHQVLTNVRTILQAVGADLNDVVKVSAYLRDIADFADYNEVYRQYFHPPYPARTTVGAQLRGIDVEIDVVAFRDGLEAPISSSQRS